jgi:hypothetical protein
MGTTVKYAATIGDGSTTSFTLTHGLGTTDLQVAVFSSEGSPPEVSSISLPSTTTATVVFDRAPATSSVRVVILG